MWAHEYLLSNVEIYALVAGGLSMSMGRRNTLVPPEPDIVLTFGSFGLDIYLVIDTYVSSPTFSTKALKAPISRQ